jgi:DNA polymerase-1
VGKTWRHEAYKEYKAHREKMPDELRMQEERVFQVVAALNIPIKVKEGFEADDVIGTLAKRVSQFRASNQGTVKVETVIVTGDMDTLQLVCDDSDDHGAVKVYKPGGGRSETIVFDEAGVMKKYGLTPRQIIDFKALAGDSSDNIPGVRGIGPKTATQLLQAFESVEGVYEQLSSTFKIQDPNSMESLAKTEFTQVLKPAVVQKLITGKESAFESKKLVTITTDVPLSFELSDALVKTYDKDRVISLFEELEFRSLIGKLPQDEFEEAVQEALF